MQFRSDALPIIVNLTDASSHKGKRALDKTGTSYDTAYQAIYTFPTWNVDDATTALIGHGARYIGIAADNGARALGATDVYGYQAYLADKTGSNVTAASYVHGGACSAAQCCTGVNASGVAADGPGGSCRSVYSINTTGAGLATAITSGVASIVKTAAFDVYVQAYNDAAEMTNVVGNFLLKVEPVAAGGTDPFSGALCVAFPSGQLADNFTGPDALVAGGDGVNDSISQINPAPTYCFNVTLKPNTTVVATSVGQIFRAWLRVRAIKPDGSIALGQDRKLFFLVPPASP